LQKITKPPVVQTPSPPVSSVLLPPPPKLTYHGPTQPIALSTLINNNPLLFSPHFVNALSSTPQLVNKSVSPPPPLVQRTQTFGSISLTPLAPSPVKEMTTNQLLQPQRRPVMVKITGKPKTTGKESQKQASPWLGLKSLQ
jgi:hypothetical protein